MAIQIQYRRGTAAEWTSANPTLAQGEPGYETDTGKFKVGNGSTAWASLAYSLGAGVNSVNGQTGAVTLTTGDVVGTTDTQTLTNKTIGMAGALDCNNNVVQEIKTATFNSQATIATPSGSITVDWTAAQNQLQTEPTGTITYTFTDPIGPCHLQLIIDSDGTSTAQTINWPGNVTWMGVIWAGQNNKKSVINFWFDGTHYIAAGTNQV